MRPSRLLLVAALMLAPAALAAQTQSLYLAVWGSSADDAWIVGTGANAMHWDGTAWSPVPLPAGTAALNAIWGSSEGDVWAVGDQGRIVRYQDGAWTTTCVRLNPDWGCEAGELSAVSGFGPNDVYVASQSPASDIPPRLYHFDGRGWTVITIPLPFRMAFRSLATVGAEIILVGTIRFDPVPLECPLTAGGDATVCILSTGVIARLSGEQWTITATGDAAAGGIDWTGLSQSERSVLAVGTGSRVASGRLLADQAFYLQSATRPATVPRGAAGALSWTSVAQPAGGGVMRATLFPRGELVAVTGAAFARRRANSWIVIPVEESTEPGTLRPANLGSVQSVWGASAADVWFAAYDRVIRLEGNVPSLAFESSCEGLGARAMGTPNCALFRGAAAPPRRNLPMPSQRQPRP